jgi:hypothetical protein
MRELHAYMCEHHALFASVKHIFHENRHGIGIAVGAGVLHGFRAVVTDEPPTHFKRHELVFNLPTSFEANPARMFADLIRSSRCDSSLQSCWRRLSMAPAIHPRGLRGSLRTPFGSPVEWRGGHPGRMGWE